MELPSLSLSVSLSVSRQQTGLTQAVPSGSVKCGWGGGLSGEGVLCECEKRS